MGTIFEKVKDKIEKYDMQRKGQQYNNAYQEVLNARAGNNSLVDEDGIVSERSLKRIEEGLRKFEMARFGKMDSKFSDKLKKKLQRDDIKEILKKFRNMRIESQEWQKYRDAVKKLYDILSAGGSDGLSADGDRFDVGATKIMNFLFPELFVMVDKHVTETLVRKGLIRISRKGGTWDYSFESYWRIMEICNYELGQYRERYGSVQSLLEMDKQPTTLTRIFDKCCFKK